MGEKTLFSQKCKKCENPEKPVNFSYFSCFWAHLEACDQVNHPPEPQKIHIRQRFRVWSLCELGFQFISLKPPFCHPLLYHLALCTGRVYFYRKHRTFFVGSTTFAQF